jgi:hypothetical protein
MVPIIGMELVRGLRCGPTLGIWISAETAQEGSARGAFIIKGMKFATNRCEISEGLLEIIAVLAATASALGLRWTKLVTHILDITADDECRMRSCRQNTTRITTIILKSRMCLGN